MHALTTIGALTTANSSWAFIVNQNTTLDRDYNEAFVFSANANDTILDCANHTIRGNGRGSGNGITLTKIQRATVKIAL